MLLVLDFLVRLLGVPVGAAPFGAAPVGALPVSGAPLASLLLVGLVGATATVALIAAARVALVVGTPRVARSRSSARDDAALRVLIVQSDPDADGHVRARAPGRSFVAARSVAL